MIALSSSLVAIITSVVIFNSINTTTQKAVESGFKENNYSNNSDNNSGKEYSFSDKSSDLMNEKKKNTARMNKQDDNSDDSNRNLDLVKKFKGDSVIKKSSEFKWNEIEYHQMNDEIQGKQVFTIFNKKNETVAFKHHHVKIEMEDLLKIYKELNDSLSQYNYFGLKGIGYISDSKEFYSALEHGIHEAKKIKSSVESDKMAEIYAIISRKLANNSNGINYLQLTNQELEKIGISCKDSSYNYNMETLYEQTPDWIKEMLNKHKYPLNNDKPLLVKVKHSIQWFINENVSNHNLNIRDGGWDPEKIDIPASGDTCKLECREYLYILDYKGWQGSEYSKICPIYSSGFGFSQFLNRSPLLYYDNGALNEYYKLLENYDSDVQNFKNKNLTVQQKDSLKSVHLKLVRDIKRLQFSLQANKLLAIKLKIPNIDNSKEQGIPSAYQYLLFVPNEEFLQALPERYSIPLRRELDAIHSIETGKLSYYEACKGLSQQETFYDVCKMESENIKDAKVFPNPAKESAKLEFVLLQERYLNITMLDMNGRYVSEIRSWQKSGPNHYSIDVNLKNIAKGMYLINITSDKGDKVVQRLIIE